MKEKRAEKKPSMPSLKALYTEGFNPRRAGKCEKVFCMAAWFAGRPKGPGEGSAVYLGVCSGGGGKRQQQKPSACVVAKGNQRAPAPVPLLYPNGVSFWQGGPWGTNIWKKTRTWRGQPFFGLAGGAGNRWGFGGRPGPCSLHLDMSFRGGGRTPAGIPLWFLQSSSLKKTPIGVSNWGSRALFANWAGDVFCFFGGPRNFVY